jgi:hypothetical protein
MARLFSIKPSLTLKGREGRGLRGWAGKPLHPPLTDFPIVCYVLVAVFDVISYFGASASVARDFFVAGTYVIIAGAIVSWGPLLPAFGTGGRAWTDDLQAAFRAKRDTRRFGALQTGIWL